MKLHIHSATFVALFVLCFGSVANALADTPTVLQNFTNAFVQAGDTVGSSSILLSSDADGHWAIFFYVNSTIGYVNPQDSTTLTCSSYQPGGSSSGYTMASALDGAPSGKLSDIADGSTYPNGRPIRTGSTYFYQNGQIFISGTSSNWFYDNGNLLKDNYSGNYYWNSGNLMREAQTANTFYSGGQALYNTTAQQIAFLNGSTFADTAGNVFYSNGVQMRNETNGVVQFFYPDGKNLGSFGYFELGKITIWYDDGKLLKTQNLPSLGHVFLENGQQVTSVSQIYPINAFYQATGTIEIDAVSTNDFLGITQSAGNINYISANTASTVPAAPAIQLTLEKITSTQATLSWQSGGGNTVGFLIGYLPGTGAPDLTGQDGITKISNAGTNTNYTVSGLSPSVAYSFGVGSVNPDGRITFGGFTYGTTQPVSSPAAPINPIVTSSTFDSLTIGWQETDPSTVGFVAAYAEGNTAPSAIGGAAVASPSVTFRGLAMNTSYSFAISAVNIDGYLSDPLTFTVSTPLITTPGISGLSPAAGPPGTVVTVQGVNFSKATALKFGGKVYDPSDFSILSDSAIRFTIPEGAKSSPLTVTTKLGSGVSAPFIVAPRISTILPKHGPISSTLTIGGANLDSVYYVDINGIRTSIQSQTPGILQVFVPNTASSGLITVANAGGSATSAVDFFVIPVISAFTPNTGAPGSVVILRGANFASINSVTLHGKTAEFTIVDQNTIQLTVPDKATSGYFRISSAAGPVASSDSFTVSPRITAITPKIGTDGTSVTISGANFTVDSSVAFNGVPAATVTLISANKITANAPIGVTTGAVQVTTLAGTATSPSLFQVAPKIYSVSQLVAHPGDTLIISGANFSTVTKAKLGNIAAAFTIQSPTQILLTVPANAVSGAISLIDKAGATTEADIVVIAPRITAFSPSKGTSGTVVTISGANLGSVTDVRFNGLSAQSFTIESSQSIQATAPNGITSGLITVINPAGTAVTATPFLAAPVVSSISASTAQRGSEVDLTGLNFTGVTKVSVGTVPTIFTVVSDSEIDFVVPATAVTAEVSITGPGGKVSTTTPLIVTH